LILLACEPLAGNHIVRITKRRAKSDWAYFIEEIARKYEKAEKIILIMDNLNTHTPDRSMRPLVRKRQKSYGIGLNLPIKT